METDAVQPPSLPRRRRAKTPDAAAGPVVALPLPPPRWLRAAGAQDMEEAAFFSGAALAHLTLTLATPDLPHPLWRERLALSAAEACARLTGRRERAADLRDAVHLTRPGEQPGPGGEILQIWRRAVAAPAAGAVRHALGEGAEALPAPIAGAAGPVARAAAMIETVLAENPRAETVALLLGDAALARALDWPHLVPLMAGALGPRDLRLQGAALRLACHRGLAGFAPRAAQMTLDLTRRARRLREVAPQLRAKAAGRAVEILLARDAVTPAAFDFMSDRAARRLCDRLVALGGVQELTGRESFRLYGL